MDEMPTSSRALAELLGISVSYAYALLGNSRPWTVSLAIRLYRRTGRKIGPLAQASSDDIDVLERFGVAA